MVTENNNYYYSNQNKYGMYYNYNYNYTYPQDYYNITYNAPLLYPPPVNYKTPQVRRGYKIAKYATEKLTEDGLRYIFDSRKKPVFDASYPIKVAKQYLSGVAWNGVLAVSGKYISKAGTFYIQLGLESASLSSCIYNEGSYLKDNNMLNPHNLKLAHYKCGGESALHLVTTKKITDSMLKTGAKVGIDEMVNRLYQPNHTDGFIDKMNLAITNGLYNYVEEPLVYVVSNLVTPIDKSIDYIIDYGFDKLENGYDKMIKYLENSNVEKVFHNLLDKGKDMLNISDDNYQPQIPDMSEFDCQNSEFGYYEPTMEEFPFDVSVEPPNLDSPDEIKPAELDVESDNFNQNMSQIMDKLNKVAKFVGLVNLIKNFNEMSIEAKIMELECLFISLKSDDPLLNGLFRFCADLAEQGKITVQSLVNLAASIAEKCLNIPLTNAFKFVYNLAKGLSIKEYIIPLIADIGSMFNPVFGIVNIVTSICKGIEALSTKQKIKEIGGIQAVYTDKHKWWKRKHKISLDNDFFDIHISCSSRHARDAKAWLEKEFKRRLDYKVYEVIGIPIEYVNGTAFKPTTRYEKYAESFYLQDLENKWLEVNDKYLNEQEKKAIKSLYFESEADKKYRYQLAKKGEAPSWYWHHKHSSIIEFCQDVYHMFTTQNGESWSGRWYTYSGFKHIIQKCISVYHQIFDNHKIKANSNLAKKEEDIRMKAFEKARDGRKHQLFELKHIIDILKIKNMLNMIRDAAIEFTKIFANNNFIINLRKHHNQIYPNEIIYLTGTINFDYEPTMNDNTILYNYRNETRKDYLALQGRYSRNQIINRALWNLWKVQQSVEYIVETGYSTYCGLLSQVISYIDLEIQELINYPMYYPYRLVKIYTENLAQSYLTRLLTDQTTLWFSLLERTEEFTDEFLQKYINPFIGCATGISIGILKYTLTWDKSKLPFKNVVINGGVSAVNSSLGIIFNYLKTTWVGTVFDSEVWSRVIDYTIMISKKVFNLALTIDFVSAILLGVIFNVGFRVSTLLYQKYFTSDYELNFSKVILSDIEGNQNNSILAESVDSHVERVPSLSSLEKNDIHPDYIQKPVVSNLCQELEKEKSGLVTPIDNMMKTPPKSMKNKKTFQNSSFQGYKFKGRNFQTAKMKKFKF